MPLDPSIILQGQQQVPLQNPMDLAKSAMGFQDMMMQNQQARQQYNDNQALRQAQANNTSVDENGNVQLNRKGMLSDLARMSPSQVSAQAQNFAQMDYNMQKQKIEGALQKINTGSQLLNGVNDQTSYERALSQMQDAGVPTNQFPPQYDPNIVQRAQSQALSYKDQLEAHAKQQGLDIEQKNADIETQKLVMEITKNKAEQNQQTLGALQALRGNSALQRAETNVLASKNINDLVEQVRDPKTGELNLNKLNPQQVSLFDHELVRMATGGTGNESDLQNLKPGTPQYKLAELHQKFTGNVSGTNSAAYIQQGLDYANTLSKSSNDFLYQNAKHVVDAKRNYLAPQDQQRYDAWLSDMKNGKSFFGDAPGLASTTTNNSGLVGNSNQKTGNQYTPEGSTKSWGGADWIIQGRRWVKQTNQASK